MKQLFILTTLSLLFNLSLAGQENKNYPFKYRLVIRDTIPPSVVSINPFEIKSGTALFSGKVVNILNIPVSYATIRAKGKDTSVLFGTNEKGEFSYPLLPGEYALTVSSLPYSSTSFQLNWKGSLGFEYLINLGKKSKGGIYIVHSKHELDQTKLDTIKNCLWYNLSSPGNCSVVNKYLVEGEL